jgi:CheY-like chemotaxis protein
MPELLLIDDRRDQLELRRLLFEQAGYAVRVAETVDSALRMVEERAPAAAIMDLRLPTAEEGRRLIRRLSLHAIRIIVLSGWPADLENTPEREHVDRLFAKPVNWKAMLDAVQKAVAQG